MQSLSYLFCHNLTLSPWFPRWQRERRDRKLAELVAAGQQKAIDEELRRKKKGSSLDSVRNLSASLHASVKSSFELVAS